MKKFKVWINKNSKYIFTLPTLIFIALLVAYPLYYTIRISFFDWGMSAVHDPVFVGIDNYKELFSESRFWDAVVFTLKFTAITLSFETLFGVILGLMLGKIKRGIAVIRTVFLLPIIATPVVVGIVWKLIYDPVMGLANYFLKWAGLPTSPWFGSSETVFTSLAIMDIWEWTPMVVLIIFAGISGLDSNVFEAAKVDGANERQTTFRITLPLMLPTILMAVILRLVDSLKTFDQIYSTTLGGPGYSSENLNILTYRYAFEYFYMGKASALLVVFFIIVLGIIIITSLLKNLAERRYS